MLRRLSIPKRIRLRTDAGEMEAHPAIRPGAAPSATWRNAFYSPALDEIIELALKGSPTLESAAAC